MATPIPTNQAKFSAEEIAVATQGQLHGAGDVQIRGVTTDSRAVRPGNLFVALRGERFDAHRFVDDAIEAGASVVVIEHGHPVPTDTCTVEVHDTLVALGAIAETHRLRWSGTVVAITGSAGKTTTKELIAAALQGAGKRVLKTVGNLNNRIGVPVTLFQLDDSFDTAVIEMGTSAPGEIALLGKMTRPDVGVITLVSVAHTEGLGSLGAVAEEKASLFDHVPGGGHLVFDGDDRTLAAMARGWKGRAQCTFGFGEACTVRIVDWSLNDEGTQCLFALPKPNRDIELTLSLLGESAAVNAAAALGVMLCLGLSVTSAGRALSAIKPIPGRMYPVSAKNGALVLDDSYNANPRSTEAALHTASALAKARGRRLVVALGDMKELGTLSVDEHRVVGAEVASRGAAVFIACGEAMQEAAASAKPGGVTTLVAGDSEEAARAALHHVEPGDVVLVKGSRSMAMERVVEALLAGEVAA